MTNFDFRETTISGAFVVTPFFAADERGYFIKEYEQDIFRAHGVSFHSSEYFISRSAKNVVRGMHFQLYHPQAKLVSVLNGAVFDVIVDLRRKSPSFGRWEGFYLSEQNRQELYIPKGCAHGFLALEDNSVVSYQCDGKYDKETDTGVLWRDPDIGIKWPIDDLAAVIVGKRDQTQMSFSQFQKECEFIYE